MSAVLTEAMAGPPVPSWRTSSRGSLSRATVATAEVPTREDGTEALRSRLNAACEPVRPVTVDFGELEGLPAPVTRYLRTVLADGQPMVAGARLHHTGTFDMGQETASWKPFTSDQVVVTRGPGFDWNGNVAMLPGVPVRVHDAYEAGEGVLTVGVLGLFPVADLRGTGDVAEGELMRFLAEAAWYPTALLPSQGVRWEAVDDRSASATLTDGDLKLLPTGPMDGGRPSVHDNQAKPPPVGVGVVPTWNDLVTHTVDSTHLGLGDKLLVGLSKPIDVSKTRPRVALELRRIGWASVDRSLWPGLMTSMLNLTEELSR